MTKAELIKRIDNIPVTEHYKDRSGNEIGMALVHWIDVKGLVLEIIEEYTKRGGTKHGDDE